MSVERSFLDCLMEKLAFAKEIEKLGVSTGVFQIDTLRQMRQVSKIQKGDINSGRGAIKSGIES